MNELLDESGEFFYNASTRVLRWYATQGVNPNTANIVIPYFIELVQIKGSLNTGESTVSMMTFSNIAFMYANNDFADCFAGSCSDQSGNFLNFAAIHVTGAQSINFANVSIAHTGGYGIWFNQGCFNSTLSHSHVSDVGAGAVRVGCAQGIDTIQAMRTEGMSHLYALSSNTL